MGSKGSEGSAEGASSVERFGYEESLQRGFGFGSAFSVAFAFLLMVALAAVEERGIRLKSF